MSTVLEQADVAVLARGLSLLGSGGGGATAMLELMLARRSGWPVRLRDARDFDPATPCLGAAFAGSTILLGERLPGEYPFAALIAAVERYLGTRIPAVCSLEGGGMNGLVPMLLVDERELVDADLTGRAVPGLDQMSLLVDGVPGIVAASETGAGGVAIVHSDRPDDLEKILRAAIIQAGGSGAVVFAGFTVGDLAAHAVHGGTARALALGRAFDEARASEPHELAARLGGRLLGVGRISAIEHDRTDPHVDAIELVGHDGAVHRLVARSEFLAFLTDGRLASAAPAVIVVLDAISREVLEVTELDLARTVCVVELPAAPWWGTPARAARIAPSAYGLAGLDLPLHAGAGA
ncbi:S-methyl thiohydantoin desulfurase domain-containing protein [Agromyces soli]